MLDPRQPDAYAQRRLLGYSSRHRYSSRPTESALSVVIAR